MNEYWGLVAQAGLWGWIVAVLILIHTSFPADNCFVIKSAVKWWVISLVFFAFWITGMLCA
jgi:hypothetical protein